MHGLDKKLGTVSFNMASELYAPAYELTFYKTRKFMQLYEVIISECHPQGHRKLVLFNVVDVTSVKE